MERLIAFGCSLTYGHGLPDCFVSPSSPGPLPSRLGWPSIVAECLGKECVNISSPGASNKKIWNDIINFDYRETDMVFVLWSYVDRTCIIHADTTTTNMSHWTGHATYYDEYYDKYDATLMSSLFVNHANMFLQNKNITVYNMVLEKTELPILKLHSTPVKHIPVYLGKIRDDYPTALDNQHPGVECQTAYSKEILEFLNIKNDLPVVKKINILKKIKRQIVGSRCIS